jgi:hypothetical protein
MRWLPHLLLISSSLPLAAPAEAAPMPEPVHSAAHVRNSFALTVHEPMHDAALLFGPEGERAWAGDEWDPQFVFPVPAQDVEGAVFTVRRGEHTTVWVNTVFDVQAGHMQYVYILADLLVATIDVRLHAIGSSQTKIEVTYVRTALRPEANEHVEAMGRHDREQGKVWERQIDAYLQRRMRH